MKLRDRIALMVTACLLILASGLLLEGWLRERGVEQRYQDATVTGLRNAWLGIVDSEGQRLLAFLRRVQADQGALRALVAADPAQYATSLTEFLATLASDVNPPVLEAVRADGTPFFTSAPAGAGVQALNASLIAAIRAETQPVRGFHKTADGRQVIVVAAPVLSREGIAGFVVLYQELARLLPTLRDSIGATVALIDDDGRPRHSVGDIAWPVGERLFASGGSDGYETHHARGHVYAVARTVLPDLTDSASVVIVGIRDITDIYERRFQISALSYFGMISLLSLFVGMLYWYMRNSFRPLNRVIRVLNALSHGDTSVSVTADNPNDEIGRLAGTVEHFRRSEQARGQLETIRRELDVATRIQLQIQPSVFPLRTEFKLFASMTPAREVGGDFYDFFDLPDGRFGFVIADVSGKGIGAAMFMAVSRTMLRTTAMIVADPVECIERVNTYLSRENDETMFVTVFYGILDPATGHVEYVNAGHNTPYLIAADGTITALESAEGMGLAIMEDIPFGKLDVQLEPGDRLLLYTDGVTEAIDVRGTEFTEDRLIVTLGEIGDPEPEAMVRDVVAAVERFAGEADQFDDITCLAITYTGADSAASA